MAKNLSFPAQQNPYGPQQQRASSSSSYRQGSADYNQRHGRQTSGSRNAYPNALDSSITRLLVTTKQLLQGLEQWSQGVISEDDVSDIYVRLGNGFETCVQAFNRAGIETYELKSIPQDLRNCLEQCLSGDQTKGTLEEYLPEIRQIIYNLLQGLKQKQSQYKRMLQERQRAIESNATLSQLTQISQQPSSVSTHAPISTITRPADAQSKRHPSRDYVEDPRLSGRSSTSTSSIPSSVNPTQLSQSYHNSMTQNQPHITSQSQFHPHAFQTSRIPSNSALAERERRAAPSRPPPPDAFRPTRTPGPRRPSSPIDDQAPQQSIHNVMARGVSGEGPQGYNIPTISISPGSRSSSTTSAIASAGQQQKPSLSINTNKPIPPRPDRFPRDSLGRPLSRFSMDSEASTGSPPEATEFSAAPQIITSIPEDNDKDGRTSADLKRRTRISGDRATRLVQDNFRSNSDSGLRSVPSAPNLETSGLPITISTQLGAQPMGQSPFPDTTRFSSHSPNRTPVLPDIPMMELLPVPEVPPETRATLAALERSDALERRASKRFSSYTFNNLNPSSPRASPQRPTRRAVNAHQQTLHLETSSESASLGAGSRLERSASKVGSPTLERVREMSEEPEESQKSLRKGQSSPTGSVRIVNTPPPASPPTPRPASPVKDPNRMKIFLQIGRKTKCHILDLPITQEQLKLVFMERFEYDPGKEDFPEVYIRDKDGMEYELEGVEDLRDGCTLCLNIEPLDQVKLHIDSTFATLLQEIKELRTALEKERETSKRLSVLVPPSLSHEMSGLSPVSSSVVTPTTSLEMPAPTPLVVGPTEDHLKQLQEQHEELENLRRELAITRQAHNEHMTESSSTISSLKDEISQLKKVTSANPNSNRSLVDASKVELDTQCTDTIKAVEDITDMIDGARIDAYKRFVTPSKQQMSTITSDLENARKLVDTFSKAVKLADPTWRGTWQTELHRVMEEQKLLNHQLKLCGDLKKDLEDAETMLSNVQDFVDQRVAGQRTAKIRVGADADVEGSDFPSLLLEIRTKESDPEQRLRAIEAQQKVREKERANKVDDFEAELKGFVGGKKLRKTGGAEEVDRMRGRKDEVLRTQLTGGSLAPQMTGGSTFSGVLSPQVTGTTSAIGGSPNPQVTVTESAGERSRTPTRAGDRDSPDLVSASEDRESGKKAEMAKASIAGGLIGTRPLALNTHGSSTLIRDPLGRHEDGNDRENDEK
ncbi:uncharacterized protein L203_102554 [Cryptococcus depauperatus CBS 7841]|uniref:Uncharacterized protein n=1 Tax=Cryptococcus depauperatus CBS 7841 TaxID=1295531 RepID=A0A1E3IDN5_9TREE|nr:cytoskeletal regulatory protein binding protein [Cryptococcus depauperatus CBS 7841]